MNKEQLYKDLVKEYDELNEKINSLDAFINSLDFEEQVHDFIERELLRGKRHCMRSYRDNLKARIKCIEYQIKKKENDRKTLDDWMNMKGKIVNTHCGPIHLINTDERPRPVCGDAIATEQERHHCGLDASCQVDDGGAVVNEAQVPNSIKSLIGMQVIDVKGEKCDYCVTKYNAPCVKVELVGGTYICLAPLPNSIVTE